MAKMGAIDVPCPECGEKVPVEIRSTTEYVDDTLRVTLTPNIDRMAEHYTLEHCGAEVSEP